MDAFLIIVAAVMFIVIVGICFLVLVSFSHPDDKNGAWFPKVVTILGLSLACASVMSLPFDVANSRGAGGGLDIGLMWQIMFILTATFVSVLIPFAYFFYESDIDDKDVEGCCDTQFCSAIKYTIVFVIFFAGVIVIMFAFLSTAQIPVQRIAKNVNQFTKISDGNIPPFPAADDIACTAKNKCLSTEVTWELQVSIPVYIMAMLSFIGWFFFALFGGIGLAALPVSLINEWRTRPVPMSLREYNTMKLQLGQRASLLRETGQAMMNEQIESDGTSMSKKDKKTETSTMNRFEQAVYLLKKDFLYMQTAFHLKGGNPLFYFFKLVMGILGIGISLTWLLHMGLFMLPEPPVHPFLNDLFEGLHIPGFPLFSVACFALWTLWLLWCCMKGNFMFGLRIPFFFKIFPMELNNTMMNAFLVNTWVILVCSVPCIQFCAQAFPVYARNTSADLLFGSQVQYLQFFQWFWTNNVFIIAMLSIAGITLVAMSLMPKDKAAEIEKKLQSIAEKEAHQLDRL